MNFSQEINCFLASIVFVFVFSSLSMNFLSLSSPILFHFCLRLQVELSFRFFLSPMLLPYHPDMLIFFLGRHPSADMTLLLVMLQHLLDLLIQLWIELFESNGDILVNCALRNCKSFCRLSHGGVLLNDILCQHHRAFFR